MREIKAKLQKNQWPIYFIFIISILLCSPMLSKGIFTAHDLDYHIHRLIGTMDALRAGQIPPLIGPKIVNDFGYGWNIFYPPLSMGISLFFYFITRSYVTSIKLYIFSTFLFSGIFMYRFVKDVTKHQMIALISALLYITAPYRLVDVYIRGAMGEILTFVFLPILFHGLYNLFHGNRSKHFYLTIGGLGLLLLHNISVMLCVIIAIIYVILNVKKLKDFSIIKLLLVNTLFIIIMALFFIVPLLEHKMSTAYMVFEPRMMSSTYLMDGHRVYLNQLLFGTFQKGQSILSWSQEGEMPYVLGLQLVLPILFIPLVWKSFKADNSIYLKFTLAGLVSLYFMSFFFSWQWLPKFFAFVQYPWRLLMFSVFFFSIPAAKVMCSFFTKIEYKHIFIGIVVIFIYLEPLINVANPHPQYIDEVYDVVDTLDPNRDGSYGAASFEYLPVTARYNLDYLRERSGDVLITEGQGEAQIIDKAYTNLIANIKTDTPTTLELPYIYYLGYRVELTSNSGETYLLEPMESEYGFVSVELTEPTEGELKVSYEGTRLTQIAYSISGIGFICFLGYCVLFTRKKDKSN